MDLGNYAGRQWLIIIDQFSGWPIVQNLSMDAPVSKITDDLLKMFEHFGLPESIFSDGGPQCESNEFAKFCTDWRISHDTSSPHYPQSNGIAENGVKAMKKLIHCCYDPSKGCLNREEWAFPGASKLTKTGRFFRVLGLGPRTFPGADRSFFLQLRSFFGLLSSFLNTTFQINILGDPSPSWPRRPFHGPLLTSVS